MNGIQLKTPDEIELMRRAGRIVAEVLDGLEDLVRPGVQLGELDEFAEATIRGLSLIHISEPTRPY